MNKAKTDGSYDEGVVDLQTGPIEQSQVLKTDGATGARTTAYTLLTHVSASSSGASPPAKRRRVAVDGERLVVIAGSVLPVWYTLAKVAGDDYALQVVRVATDDGQRIAGVRFPPDRLSALRDELERDAQQTQAMAIEVEDPTQVDLGSIRDAMTEKMRERAAAGGASASSSASASNATSVGVEEPRGAATNRNER